MDYVENIPFIRHFQELSSFNQQRKEQNDYLSIVNLTDNYETLISKYNFDYLLVQRMGYLNTYLNSNDKYELIYRNKDLLLYKKTVN